MASRYFNFRQGDRSELLADYLLSGIGITTPIRRQDDTGFDFYCSISDQEKGILTFGSPYIIQIKSKANDNSIIYGVDDPQKWEYHQVEWLYRNELPLFFGIVDKKNQSIAIHDCSSFGYSKINNAGLPAMVVFEPRADVSLIRDIGKPIENKIESWNNNDSNGKIYRVDIGHPIITLNNADFNNDELIKKKKDLFRQAISIQSRSLLFYKQNLGYLNWIVNNIPNETIRPGWAFFTSQNPNGTKNTINNNAEGIISIGLHAKLHKQSEIVGAIKIIAQQLQPNSIPPQIKNDNPDLF